jgi:hypothetical protein
VDRLLDVVEAADVAEGDPHVRLELERHSVTVVVRSPPHQPERALEAERRVDLRA